MLAGGCVPSVAGQEATRRWVCGNSAAGRGWASVTRCGRGSTGHDHHPAEHHADPAPQALGLEWVAQTEEQGSTAGADLCPSAHVGRGSRRGSSRSRVGTLQARARRGRVVRTATASVDEDPLTAGGPRGSAATFWALSRPGDVQPGLERGGTSGRCFDTDRPSATGGMRGCYGPEQTSVAAAPARPGATAACRSSGSAGPARATPQ